MAPSESTQEMVASASTGSLPATNPDPTVPLNALQLLCSFFTSLIHTCKRKDHSCYGQGSPTYKQLRPRIQTVYGGLRKADCITRKWQNSFWLLQKPYHLPSPMIRPQRFAGSAFLNTEPMVHPPGLRTLVLSRIFQQNSQNKHATTTYQW